MHGLEARAAMMRGRLDDIDAAKVLLHEQGMPLNRPAANHGLVGSRPHLTLRVPNAFMPLCEGPGRA